MNFTLHLTADCNMACRYCFQEHSPVKMEKATALAACDLLFSFGHRKNGFSLFGGEPLLCRDVIEEVLTYCEKLNEKRVGSVSYQMTTNGTLLDESFLKLADKHDIAIALSHDGLLQDIQRVRRDKSPTLAALEEKIDLLLSHQPNAIAMLTVMPENIGLLSKSVEWLYKRGFSRVNAAIDYRPEAPWDDASMDALDREYQTLAALCAEHYDDPRPLRFLNFESKIAAFLEDRRCIECRLGIKQPSIAPDGIIYPCNQFLNLKEYRMGDVWNGIDAAAQRRINEASNAQEVSCEGCAIEKRCRHHCSCLNFSMTGDMHTVPAVQCMHEQSVIRNADALAAELYKRKSPRFMRAYKRV